MYIFEIIKPGIWLESDNRDWAWGIETILSKLENDFYDANQSLNMFISAQSAVTEKILIGKPQKEMLRRREIEQLIRESYKGSYHLSMEESIRLEAEIEFKREQWRAGKTPHTLEHKQSFITARAFLYALDSFDKSLGILIKQKNIPETVSSLHDEMTAAFPHLRGVRNSAQHMEDRSRGLGAPGRERKPEPLDLKPVDNNLVKSLSGALILNGLSGTKYGNTMADGHYGEVDVSPDSMEALRVIFQKLLDSFSWSGSKRHLP